ncbi:unnamed protein product, partial [Polarella glacialis]
AYGWLQYVIVPFPITLDCNLVSQLTSPGRKRPLAVAFVGSENSRVRHLFKIAAEDPRWRFHNDTRIHVRVLPDEGLGEAARRAAFGGDEKGGSSMSIGEIYGSAEFCLVLPGHLYDLGRRAYDAM